MPAVALSARFYSSLHPRKSDLNRSANRSEPEVRPSPSLHSNKKKKKPLFDSDLNMNRASSGWSNRSARRRARSAKAGWPGNSNGCETGSGPSRLFRSLGKDFLEVSKGPTTLSIVFPWICRCLTSFFFLSRNLSISLSETLAVLLLWPGPPFWPSCRICICNLNFYALLLCPHPSIRSSRMDILLFLGKRNK